MAIADAFEGISITTQRELDKQASLLAGLQADLAIVERVAIHREFMSATVKKAIDQGGEGRTLGDYVSRVKMNQVAETCTRTHGVFLPSSVLKYVSTARRCDVRRFT